MVKSGDVLYCETDLVSKRLQYMLILQTDALAKGNIFKELFYYQVIFPHVLINLHAKG